MVQSTLVKAVNYLVLFWVIDVEISIYFLNNIGETKLIRCMHEEKK